jgi:hypothetical protein
MCKTFLLIVALCSMVVSNAQSSSLLTVRAGQKISDVITRDVLFEYREFQQGTVHFRDGKDANGLLNYNRLLDEIQFIDDKEDTLSLADVRQIDEVWVGQDRFVYRQGWYKVSGVLNDIQIAEKHNIRLSNIEKKGLYNQAANSGTSYSQFGNSGKDVNLVLSQDITFDTAPVYFLLTTKTVLPLNLKNARKTFPSRASAIDALPGTVKADPEQLAAWLVHQ